MSIYRQIMQDSPTGFWPLDEAAGTTAIDVVSGRNGTYNGTVSYRGTKLVPGLSTWLPNTAGASYVQVSYAAAFDAGTGDFSVECWYYANGRVTSAGSSGNEPLFNRDFGSSGNGVIVYVRGGTGVGGDGKLAVYGGSSVSLVGTKDLQDGVPHHICATRTASTLTVYVDGVVDATGGSRGNNVNTSGSPVMWFGGAAASGNTRETSVAYQQYRPSAMVAFYVGTALAADRVKAHYQAGMRQAVSV